MTVAPSSCSISATCRWPNMPYAATDPWFSEKCVRSLGARPAPEMPDLASTIDAGAGVEQARLARAAAAPAARPSDSSPGWRRASRRGHRPGSARSARTPRRPAASCVAGYQLRPRAASSRMRNAPDRSMTRTPASTSGGASSAAAFSGTARNTTSMSVGEPLRVERLDRAVPDPGQPRQGPRGRIRPTTTSRPRGGRAGGGPAAPPVPDRRIRWLRRLPPAQATNKYSSEAIYIHGCRFGRQ